MGRPLVLPLARLSLGTFLLDCEEVEAYEYRNMTAASEIEFVADALALPKPLATALLVSIGECELAGLTRTGLRRWGRNLFAVSTPVQALLPCLECSVLCRVTLPQIFSAGSTRGGVTCSQLGLECQSESEPSLQGVRVSPARNLDSRSVPPPSHMLFSDAECPTSPSSLRRGKYGTT